MRAIVTAGGTREAVDDVRFLGNRSSGSLGVALARTLAARGAEVCLLAGQGVDTSALCPEVEVVRFDSAATLQRRLEDRLQPPPDLVCMAAAVADYSPVPAEGKIRSDAEELVLHLRRNPKILDGIRGQTGPRTVLVGFKLLSGVAEQTLLEVARGQNARCDLNLTFANDAAEVAAHHHAGWLVPRQGEPTRVQGTKRQIALAIVDACLALLPGRPPFRREAGPPPRRRDFECAGVLLRTLRDMGLYPAEGAALSHRTDAGLWITPRQGEAVTSDDLVHVTRSGWCGPGAPAPSALEHADLYAHLPEVVALVELPKTEAVFLEDTTTTGGAPEALHALARAALQGRWRGPGFTVRTGEGHLMGIGDIYGLLADWAEIRERALDAVPGLPDPRLKPIFASSTVIGALICSPALDPAVAVWVQEPHRRQGWGDAIAARIAHRPVLVDETCASWFLERGWRDTGNGARRLEPAATRRDLRRAASVCLLDPATRQVLLGARRTAPWSGYWAFPGGSVEPGEGLLAAALRELQEETGIALPPTVPLRSIDLHVGTADHAFHLTCFVLPTFSRPAPSPSAELEARWLPLDRALSLRPMAAGTRRVLRALQKLR